MTDEPMTGWDDPDDLPTAFNVARSNPGRIFLQTLAQLLSAMDAGKDLTPHFDQLQQAMRDVDWHLVDWVLTAQFQGQEIFSCYPGNDVLTRYESPRPPDKDQQELAF